MLAQRNLIRRTLDSLSKQRSFKRNYQPGTRAYDGDGKTSVSVLNKEEDGALMINAYSQIGFRLNNGMFVVGPMVIFPRTVMSWNIGNFTEVNEKTLSLFTLLEPKIDVLVIGSGDEQITPSISKGIIFFMRQHKINVEVLPTEQACTTFNFLNSEGRMTAAAIIPPLIMQISETDYVQHRLQRDKMLELD